jgi:hypothetical protein
LLTEKYVIQNLIADKKGKSKLFFIRIDLAPPLQWRPVVVNHRIICAFEPF